MGWLDPPGKSFQITVTPIKQGGDLWSIGAIGALVLFVIGGIGALFGGSQPQSVAPKTQELSKVRTHFVPLEQGYPLPNPAPMYRGRHPSGRDMYEWRGRLWSLERPHKPFEYLCVFGGGLSWCWQNPPRSYARACTRNSDGVRGWCYEE